MDQTFRPLLGREFGVEAADSWATDGHQWLNVPFDCGYALVAEPEAHRAAMSHRAAYLTHDAEASDQFDWNPEWSRRARGFPTYAALRQLGRDGVAALVESSCKHAHSLVMGIGRLPGVEVLCEPVINQGLVRFLDPKAGASDRDHDRRTDEVIAAIAAGGEAFFTGSTWNGNTCNAGERVQLEDVGKRCATGGSRSSSGFGPHADGRTAGLVIAAALRLVREPGR